MADDDATAGENPDDFAEMLRRLLSGGAGIDPEEISRMTGMTIDPAMMQQVMAHLQGAFRAGGDGIDWNAAKQQALHIANQSDRGIAGGAQRELDQAFVLASLWLGESTTISDLGTPATAITRGAWVEQTLPFWQEVAEPVATSIADALTSALGEQVPEDMREMVQNAGRVMRGIGGSLFATQLGQVVGRLSTEVVSGGDVGLPVMPSGVAAILPQNFDDFGRDLEVEHDQLALYIAVRELAHARLFRHAKWLRLHVISQVTEFARGIHVDTGALEDLAGRVDPSNPDELRAALESGALLPERSEAQTAALTRLENLLATIEGWVDVVTADATSRLPHADRIAETVRRRRAVGGPAEKALASLVGLEVRPRRMREAAAMWRAITDAVGIAGRDGLWDYADLMPGAQDIDDPTALIARLRGDEADMPPDAFDDALAALLEQAEQENADGTSGGAPSGGQRDEPGEEEPGEDGPEDQRPV